MKKITLTKLGGSLLLLCVSLMACVSFTSCDSDGDDWWGTGPYGWTFDDSRLTGFWQLIDYNGAQISPNEANYLYFNGNGSGTYYYLTGGKEERESLRYWCQDAVSGSTNYQVNIRYQYTSPLTCNYYFSNGNNLLIMTWYANGVQYNYTYTRIQNAPW